MIYRNLLGKPSQTEKALLDDQPALKSFTIQLLLCKYSSLYHASKFTNLTTAEIYKLRNHSIYSGSRE